MAEQAINYKVLVAIYTKFQQIYGDKNKQNKFLSFPGLSRHSYDPEQLDALAYNRNTDTDDSRETDRRQAEFSQLVNMPPRDILFGDNDDDMLLWDAYNSFAHSSIIAECNYSDEDKKAFEEVQKFLFEGGEFSVIESEAYKKYKECRDRYFIAQETLNDKKTRYQLRNDEESKIELEMAQNNLNSIEEEWKTIGNKNEVEKYLDRYEQLSMAYPSLLLQSEKSFNLDEVLLTCVTAKTRYAPTYLFPSDLSKKTDWIKVSLNKEDIEKLLQHAPEELLVGMEEEGLGADSEISEVTFECRSAKIDRPWFKKEAMTSRYWKFLNTFDQALFSYGTEKLEDDNGTFPAYITSVVLMRNLKVVKISKNVPLTRKPQFQTHRDFLEFQGSAAAQVERNKRVAALRRKLQEASKTASQQPQESNKDEVTIMAYICSRFGLCPNPAPDAKWPGGLTDYNLAFKQSGGGKIHATVNDRKVEGGAFSRGQKIVLKAVPDTGYLIKSWIINDQHIEAKGNTYTIEMPEGGLNVTAVWHESKTADSGTMELSADRKTLTKWSTPDSEVDMNEYSDLTEVTTIASRAFEGCKNLRKIRIGDSVTTIASKAFSNCEQLDSVELPESVLDVNETAFEIKRKNSGPTFIVHEANKRYTAVDGVLVEKEKTARVKVFNCGHCSFAAFMPMDGSNDPTICPYCGGQLVRADDRTIIMPEEYLPFKLSEAAAKEAVMEHYRKQHFVKKEFIEAAEKDLVLRQMYLPIWEFSATADSDYTATIEHDRPETITNTDGTTTTKHNIERETKTGHVSNDFTDITYTASKLYTSNPLSITNAAKLKANNDLWNSGITFEQYAISPRQMTKDVLSDIDSRMMDLARTDARIGIEKATIDLNTIYTKLHHHLVMRPVWIGSVEFEGKDYPVFVSGYKGSINKTTKVAIDKKKRAKTYALIAAAIALAILILYLVISHANQNSNNVDVTDRVNTEKVVTSSGTATDSKTVNRPPAIVKRPATGNTVNRPSANVERPATGNTVNRPSANVERPATGNTVNRPPANVERPVTGNTVNRPPANVERPATGNTVNRPSNGSQSNNGQNVNQGQSNNSNSGKTGSRRAGTRRR